MRTVAATILALLVSGVSSAEPARYVVDPGESRIAVHVEATGWAGPLGVLHDHEFIPSEWSGEFVFDPDRQESLQGEIRVDASSLRDRQPALSEGDRKKVERQVRGEDILDAESHPTIELDLTGLEEPEGTGQSLTGVLRGTLTIRGESKPVEIPVEARMENGELTATGEFTVLQTEFGIKPYRRFLGAAGVEDEVRITFDIQASAPDPSE